MIGVRGRESRCSVRVCRDRAPAMASFVQLLKMQVRLPQIIDDCSLHPD